MEKKISRYPELLEGFANKLKDAVNEDDDVKDEVYKLMRSGEDRKWNVLNGMVLLLKRRRINYAVFKWGLLILLPNFLK